MWTRTTNPESHESASRLCEHLFQHDATDRISAKGNQADTHHSSRCGPWPQLDSQSGLPSPWIQSKQGWSPELQAKGLQYLEKRQIERQLPPRRDSLAVLEITL